MRHVPSGGYRWWYVDAIDDAGERALVAIFFVGSAFSPHYARRLRRGEAPAAEEHVAVNLALYDSKKTHTWIFSEYGPRALSLSDDSVSVATCHLARKAEGLEVHIDARTVLHRRRVVGHLSLVPLEPALTEGYVSLARGHEWRAHVPRARVEAFFPGFRLSGVGYHDENCGTAPLEQAIRSWSWCRFHGRDTTHVAFDVEEANGARTLHGFATGTAPREEMLAARAFRPSGRSWLAPLPERYLAGWDEAGLVSVEPRRLLEPAPFYARYLARASIGGALAVGMLEHVAFERVRHPLVERMVALRLARPERGEHGWVP